MRAIVVVVLIAFLVQHSNGLLRNSPVCLRTKHLNFKRAVHIQYQSSTSEDTENTEKPTLKKRLLGRTKKISVQPAIKEERATASNFSIEDLLGESSQPSQSSPSSQSSELSQLSEQLSELTSRPKKVYDELPEEFASFGKTKAPARVVPFERCDKVNVVVTSFGNLGVSVEILSNSDTDMRDSITGLILYHEIEYWNQLHGKKPLAGEVLPGFILNIRSDGKLDISLRPIGFDKVLDARDKLMAYMESTSEQQLPLGDKSSPEDIWALFPGLTKSQYKYAVGALLREGAITTSEKTIDLVPVHLRKPMEAAPYSGKSPKGWRAPAASTLFIGNLAFEVDDMLLAATVEGAIGYGKIASVKIASDPDTQESRGFAHIDCFNENIAEEAAKELNGLEVGGRRIRVERKKRLEDLQKQDRNRAQEQGERPGQVQKPQPSVSTRFNNDDRLSSNPDLATVYVGDLPYKISDESLKNVLESSLSNGVGAVAEIRQAVHRDSGLKRGFAHVDFIDLKTAERAVKELQGMSIMGRWVVVVSCSS